MRSSLNQSTILLLLQAQAREGHRRLAVLLEDLLHPKEVITILMAYFSRCLDLWTLVELGTLGRLRATHLHGLNPRRATRVLVDHLQVVEDQVTMSILKTTYLGIGTILIESK